jgi:hypothetical protein
MKDFSTALEIKPKDIHSRSNLGLMKFFQGDIEEGLAEMKTPLSQNPNFSFVYTRCIYGELKRKNIEAAKDTLNCGTRAIPANNELKIAKMVINIVASEKPPIVEECIELFDSHSKECNLELILAILVLMEKSEKQFGPLIERMIHFLLTKFPHSVPVRDFASKRQFPLFS